MAARKTNKPSEQKPEPLNTYGYPVLEGMTQLGYDRLAFARRTPIENGAPSRWVLFKRITDKILPNHFEWHSWTEKAVKTMCEHSLSAFPGCAGSAKTYNIASFAVGWWLCDPDQSSVTFVSTSKQALSKRGWAEVRRCYTSIPGPRIGNFVESRMMWQCAKGDSKHAITGRAVEEGSTDKVADDIKGVHTRRQMIVIDEATAVPEAIWEACTNLYAYPEEFVLICMGNPKVRLDQFGKFIEPEDGWLSVNVDTEEWEGKPQDKYGGRKPMVVRFDAEKSPNIIEGRLVSKHLPTKEKVEAAQQKGGGQTPSYWQNVRGFPPPEGISLSVFTESMLLNHNGYGKLNFTGRNFSIIGAFDSARGGDRAMLRFGKLGEIQDGKMGIESFPPIEVPLSSESSKEKAFQLFDQVVRHCRGFTVKGVEYSCLPENFIADDTNEGALNDIFMRDWGRIHRVKFSHAASDDSVSLEDLRPAREAYENKRVEMYFRARDSMMHGQLKGIDKPTAKELCNIEEIESPKRVKLMDKKEYRAKFKESPDLSDTLVMMVELARLKGFRLSPIGKTADTHNDWTDTVDNAQKVYEEAEYHEEEFEEDFV